VGSLRDNRKGTFPVPFRLANVVMRPYNLKRGGVILGKKYMINVGKPLKRRIGFTNTESGISTRGGNNVCR